MENKNSFSVIDKKELSLIKGGDWWENDFSTVKQQEKPSTTVDIQARAYTSGSDIYFNGGGGSSSAGSELMNHPLTAAIR